MSEYTPTIRELREAWLSAEFEERNSTTSDDDLRAEFDRALAAHDAEVRATALAEALSTEAHPWELLDFRQAWEAADARFEAGTRVRQGLAAMLTRRASLLTERLGLGVLAEEPMRDGCTCPSGDGSLRWPCPSHPPQGKSSDAFHSTSEPLLSDQSTTEHSKETPPMSTDLEKAQADALKARKKIDETIPRVADVFRTTLANAFDKMIDITVIEQHAVTSKLDPAELSGLKVALTQATEQAINSVDSKLDNLDIDRLAGAAKSNWTGGSFVEPNTVLGPLLGPALLLLRDAGYNLNHLGGGYSAPKLHSIPNVGYEADTAARELDRAIEDYGKLKITINELEHERSKDGARSAWDQA